MNARNILYVALVGVSILSLLSLFIPGFNFPILFLFFPFVFGTRSFRSQGNDHEMRPRYCHLCGYKLKPNWQYCPSCSEPVELEPTQEQSDYFSRYR